MNRSFRPAVGNEAALIAAIAATYTTLSHSLRSLRLGAAFSFSIATVLDRIHDDMPGPVRDERLAHEAAVAEAMAHFKADDERINAERTKNELEKRNAQRVLAYKHRYRLIGAVFFIPLIIILITIAAAAAITCRENPQ